MFVLNVLCPLLLPSGNVFGSLKVRLVGWGIVSRHAVNYRARFRNIGQSSLPQLFEYVVYVLVCVCVSVIVTS